MGDSDDDDGFVNPALSGMLAGSDGEENSDDDDDDSAFAWNPSMMGGGESDQSDEEDEDAGYGGGEPAAGNSLDLLSSMLAGVDMADAMRQPEPEKEEEQVQKKVQNKTRTGGVRSVRSCPRV
jgi:hypothetical protein